MVKNHRRRFGNVACLCLVIAGVAAAQEKRGARPPNFVLLFIDDLGYGDVGPFGSKLTKTPNLDAMAAQGLKLTSFYAAPVCSPSRASLMTGCYPKRVGIPRVLFPVENIGINAAEHTLPELLKERGYATMCIGKWHLGDQDEFLPTRHGFDHYFGLPYSNDMTPERAGEAAAGKNGKKNANTGRISKYPPLTLIRDETPIQVIKLPDQDRLVEMYTDEAVTFLREQKDRHSDKPFFLYLAHNAVHAPHHPGAKWRGHSGHGVYNDWVEEVDWSCGKVLDTIRELGLSDDTLVLFTSDNGGTRSASNAPLRGFKASTWEGGMREPTIALWPGKVPAGAACDAVLSEIDILPTFVKLAGGQVPTDRKIDGTDIWPILSGQSKKSPHEAFFYFNVNNLEAVRSGEWKLKLPGTLYNLDKDIGETTDVAKDHPDVVKRLQGYASAMDGDLGEHDAGPGCRPPGKVEHPKPLKVAPSK